MGPDYFLRMNLHNHTVMSHGGYSARNIADEAVKGGLNFVGVADHYKKKKHVHPGNLEEYLSVLSQIKEEYREKISFLASIEIPCSICGEEEFALFKRQRKAFDYILFDKITSLEDLQPIIEFKRQTGLLVGLAHVPLVHMDLKAFLRTCAENQFFIELNSNRSYGVEGQRNYEGLPELPKILKDLGIKVSIGSDTHSALAKVNDIEKEVAYIKAQGLEELAVTKELV